MPKLTILSNMQGIRTNPNYKKAFLLKIILPQTDLLNSKITTDRPFKNNITTDRPFKNNITTDRPFKNNTKTDRPFKGCT